MTLLNKTLDILFRWIEPEEILAHFYDDEKLPELKALYMAKAESTLGGFSYEEKENTFAYFFRSKPIRVRKDTPRQLSLVAQGAADMLTSGEKGPVCRYPKTLEWREAYLRLGQDIFTTSLLARESLSRPRTRWFSWPAVIPVDDPILNSVTVELAENHMHLMAGASTFSLTWACLMNHPEAILRRRKELEVLLQPHISRGTANIWPIRRRILYAAKIRSLLFKRIRGEAADAAYSFRSFHLGYSLDEMECLTLSREIDALRYRHGLAFPQPGTGRSVCLDYAFTGELADQRDEHSRLLASERLFLFDCFRMTYDGSLREAEQWLFYSYLLLKAQFRSELVQVNQQTGFHNFHDYDDRKALLWKGDYPEYMNEDYRQTVNANIREQRICSLEGRFSPAQSARADVERAHAIDRACMFYEEQTAGGRFALDQWKVAAGMKNMAADASHFYVLHFPKLADPHLYRKPKHAPMCRHEKFRRQVRERALALASALSNYDYFCERVRGIDACSWEIACRPEVFAVAFRFLRDFPAEHYRWFPCASGQPRLGLTYHVGEDFLDISDGLRSVDEAVRFLGMRRGDRIGHATVLGVDPRLHYARKSRQVIMSKQEALDNCVWIYYRSGELDVEIPLVLRQAIYLRATALFNEIYRARLKDPGTTLEDYYYSMQLRGDDPRCYESGAFRRPPVRDGFDMHCLNDSDASLDHLRRQARVSELCFCYHYCRGALNTGSQMDTILIEDNYICLMEQLQAAMRRYVNDTGLSVECNPSSNVLIGTFGAYRKHPILTFYNEGLGVEHREVQLHVSVNTDDPGVFDTSLSFEYALLARALQEMTDEEGRRVNSDRAIEAYIRSIVRMGQEQTFPGAKCGSA